MKLLTLGALLVAAAPSWAQSLDRIHPELERPASKDEPLLMGIAAGLTLFDISDSSFKDAQGIGIVGNVGVTGHASEMGTVEMGYYAFASDVDGVSNSDFTLNILTIGGGYRWGMGMKSRLTMGATGGYLYYFSSDISPKNEFNDGIYLSFFASARITETAAILLRFNEMYVGSSGKIAGDGMDWITAMTIGVDFQF